MPKVEFLLRRARFGAACCALAACLAWLAGCSKDIQNPEAIKQAVSEYLNAKAGETGLDMSMMDLQVTSVNFQQDQARATVYFKLKTGQGGMSMNYALDRKGDKWVVRGRQDSAANPHGAGASLPQASPELPPGHPSGANPSGASPQGGEAAAPGTQLPPGHPSVGTTPGGPLPAGHPPIGSKQ